MIPDKKIELIKNEVAITPNDNMRFKTHFGSDNDNIKGWYVID